MPLGLLLRISAEEKIMLCLAKPNRGAIDAFLRAQQSKKFSYAEVGYTRQEAPKGYVADHHRIQLGHGADVFERAKCAVRNWKMFAIPWVELHSPETAIVPGANVAVLVSHLGFWSVNACRIVYVIDEHVPTEKYGFAYGTLPEHGECSEERFTVEIGSDQTVWYDLYAFSRPNRLARIAYPFARHLQKRFAEDSKAAMHQAIRFICSGVRLNSNEM